jgi:hypothetical protein
MSVEQITVVQEEEIGFLVDEPEVTPQPAATVEPIRTRGVPGQQSQLFMVRMWPEPLDGGQVEWRGEVNHVATGERYPFRDWARLSVCMERMLQPGFRTGHGVG